VISALCYQGTRLSHPPRLPHLQLDDGPELTPRRVPNHHQLAFDDDRLRHVEALVRLAPGELNGAQDAGRTRRFDEDKAVNQVGGAAGQEHEVSGARLSAGGVKIGQPEGADRRGVRHWRSVQGEQGGQQSVNGLDYLKDGKTVVFTADRQGVDSR